MNRELQKYDTISKKGNFYRIVSIDEDGVITAKRTVNDSYSKGGRPVIGTKEELEKRGYRFHDIPPVTCYQADKAEPAKQEEKTPDPVPETPVTCNEPNAVADTASNAESDAVVITRWICLTLIALKVIGRK